MHPANIELLQRELRECQRAFTLFRRRLENWRLDAINSPSGLPDPRHLVQTLQDAHQYLGSCQEALTEAAASLQKD